MRFPRAVLIDLDNTVYPYQPCHDAGLRAAQGLAARLHSYWSAPARFVRHYEEGRQLVKSQLGSLPAGHCRLLYFKRMVETQIGRTDIEAIRGLHEAYWQGYFSKMKPDAGCIELLTDLRASRVRVALVSNYTTERPMLKLRALGLERVADFLITSEEVGAEKPSPTPFEYALARLRVRSREAWMVGDNLQQDIGAARALGLTAVWFQRPECRDTGEVPDFIVRDWFELRELLDRERNH